MRHVNLLPADAYAGRRWLAAEQGGPETTKRLLALAGAATALVLVVLIAVFIHARGLVNDREETLATLQQQVAEADAAAAKARAEQEEAKAHLAAVVTVAGQRTSWERSLRELAQVLPSNALLSSLVAQAPVGVAPGTATAPTVGAAATGFSVTGLTTSQRAVALVLDRLALLPWLSDVTLQTSARTDAESASAVQFTIGANVRSTGGP